MEQITCKGLAIGYDNHILVDNINFGVNKGDYICIIGENGVGKSTLMKTLVNLNKPIKGQVIIADDISRKQFGYLTQQKQIQKDFPGSVKEIVISGCQNKCGFRPFYNKQEKKLALEAIQKMGISNLENKCFSELSGGQQQRVLMARALCATDKILFLDEPATGLDQKTLADLYAITSSINKEDGITIVMISHDINTAVKYASHILYIGQEVTFQTKEQYLISSNTPSYTEKGGGC